MRPIRLDYPLPARRAALAGLAGLAAVLLTGCAATAPMQQLDAPPGGGDASAAAGAGPIELTFVDLDSFDTQMEKALATGAPVEVGFMAPMSPNAIAPRLGRWINTVKDSGGEVVVKNDTKTRSLSLITGLLDAVYAAWRDMRYRSLVKDVKVEIHVAQNEIQHVSFVHKNDAGG